MEIFNYMEPVVKDLNSIPESHQSRYVKDEESGEYKFEVNKENVEAILGAITVDAAKNRRSNAATTELKKTNKALTSKLEKNDTLFEKLNARLDTMDENINRVNTPSDPEPKDKGADTDSYKEAFDRRTKELTRKYENQITAITKEAEVEKEKAIKYKKSRDNIILDGAIRDAATEVGNPVSGAMQDILGRGKRVFKVEEDPDDADKVLLVPYSEDGLDNLYGVDAKAYLTPKEWAASVMKETPYLWQESSGGGAQGSRNTNTNPGKLAPNTVHRDDHAGRIKYKKEIQAGTVKVVGVGR